MFVRGVFYLYDGCVLQRLRRKFLLLVPPLAEIVRDDIEPPRELIRIPQR